MANYRSKTKSAVKRAVRKNPKAVIIAAVAIVLVIAIALCVLYFGFRDVWDSIFNPASDLTLGEGELKVHFIDVGQGDCIYIQFPDGTDMIIDCGTTSSGYKFEDTKAYIDALNSNEEEKTINHLMLTHTDKDHVSYLDDIIKHYQIDNIYMPNVLSAPSDSGKKADVKALDASKLAMFTDPDTESTAVYADFFIAALQEENCTIHLNIDPDDSTNSIVIEQSTYRLTFYCPTEEYYESSKANLKSPESKNGISPIGILEYNNRRVVFTGDSNKYNEPEFTRRIGLGVDCDVLKVGHHGSETSSSDAFLNAVECEYAVISCNKSGNNFKHPRQETLDRFIARNMTVYRTDNNGTVVLTIDKDSNLTFDVETTVSQSINLIGGNMV